MRKFKGYASTGTCGSDVEFEFEADDDATDEEISEIFNIELWNHIDVGYWEEEDYK